MIIGNTKIGRLALGPMAGVTDLPFRLLCKEQGVDLIYTEMVSAKGIHYNNRNTQDLLRVNPEERPAAVQLFGSEPEIMAETAKRIEAQPFDFFDINMGCPVPKVVNNHEGSALMLDPPLAGKIVEAMTGAVKKPVFAKIRAGFDPEHVNAPEVAKVLEDSGASLVAVHGRTRVQYYSGKADRDVIRRVKESVSIPVIGNGDIACGRDAARMILETGCDGVMIGRAAQGNPWIFRQVKDYLEALGGYEALLEMRSAAVNDGRLHGEMPAAEKETLFNELLPVEIIKKPSFKEVMETIDRHTGMLIEYKGEETALRELRKHVAWYTEGYPYSARLRGDINTCSTREQMRAMLAEYLERIEFAEENQ